MSECCKRDRDFMSLEPITVCHPHRYRGSLPCPWPECCDRTDWRFVEPSESLPKVTKEPIDADAVIGVTERTFVRKTMAVPQLHGSIRMYYWEERK